VVSDLCIFRIGRLIAFLQITQIFHCAHSDFRFLGGNSQNFLHKFGGFFVTLGLKILRFLRLKVLFEADIINGWC